VIKRGVNQSGPDPSHNLPIGDFPNNFRALEKKNKKKSAGYVFFKKEEQFKGLK
tara:strand:- start:128 stop:289 length:162 start_codon:yes stop_codon:yes gene_type:complete